MPEILNFKAEHLKKTIFQLMTGYEKHEGEGTKWKDYLHLTFFSFLGIEMALGPGKFSEFSELRLLKIFGFLKYV